jgi:hypothetical protein
MTDSVNNTPSNGKVWVPGKKQNLNSSNLKDELLRGLFLTFVIILILACVGFISYLGGKALSENAISYTSANEVKNFNEKIQGNTLSYTTPEDDTEGFFPVFKSESRIALEQSWVDGKIGPDSAQIAGGTLTKTNVLLFDNKETFYQILEDRIGDKVTLTLSEVPKENLEEAIVEINKIQFGDTSKEK